MAWSWSSESSKTHVADISFFPYFASPTPDTVDVAAIADQIEYIAQKTSRHK